MSLEMLGYVLLILVVLGGAAVGLNEVFLKNDIANLERDLVAMRMNTKQRFQQQRNYNNISNEIAIQGGLAPKSLIAGDNLRHTWDGDITLSSNSGRGSFLITLLNIPQKVCAELGSFQSGEWLSINVNGSATSGDDVAGIISSCQESNTLVFEAR